LPSKGLGAPVGSVLLGKKDFLKTAHRYRKMMGGGMRQAGILAAGGLYALRHGPARLADDHTRAKTLATGLKNAGFDVNLETVQTNMVFITVPDAAKTVQEWTDKGVWCGQMDVDKVRLVTHFQQTDDDIVYVLERITKA
jgi:threonine aldolase